MSLKTHAKTLSLLIVIPIMLLCILMLLSTDFGSYLVFLALVALAYWTMYLMVKETERQR